MMTMVSNRVTEVHKDKERKQQPDLECTLRKKLYFNPGQ